ncbi:MAG: PilZ domain-containing protein [Chitinispirillia bacterium]|jgi:hypothetical protein
MRKFIRHPSDVPIIYDIGDIIKHEKECLNNISKGGISFRSKDYIEPASKINIKIPLVKNNITISGMVVWCRKKKRYYDIGVKFIDKESEFRMRMVEQVCYIEHYKKEIFKKEKRELSGEEAAKEWISKYAHQFPSLY